MTITARISLIQSLTIDPVADFVKGLGHAQPGNDDAADDDPSHHDNESEAESEEDEFRDADVYASLRQICLSSPAPLSGRFPCVFQGFRAPCAARAWADWYSWRVAFKSLWAGQKGRCMQFHIGPFVWRVRLVTGHIDMLRGDISGESSGGGATSGAWGLCDFERQVILVSDAIPADARVAVICHELWHAWRYHFPVDIEGDEERASDYFAALGLSLVRDLFGGLPRSMVDPPREGGATEVYILSGIMHPMDGQPPRRITLYIPRPPVDDATG